MDTDRLSVLLGGAAVGFTLSRVVQLPAQRIGIQALGSQLGLELTTTWWVTAFVVGLTIVGCRLLFVSHPLHGRGQAVAAAIHWILPGETALVSGAVLAQLDHIQVWLPTLLASIAILGLVIASEYRCLDPAQRSRPAEQLLSAIIIYGLALILLNLLLAARARALLSVPAALVTIGLLVVRLLWNSTPNPRQALLYGGVMGLLLSQAVWALNYLLVSPLTGSMLLLLVLYVTTGLVQQSIVGRLNRRTFIELGAAALVAALLLAALR